MKVNICPKCKDTDDQTKYFPKSYYEYMGWKYIDNYCFDCDVEKIESEVINETVPYNDILEANKGVK